MFDLTLWCIWLVWTYLFCPPDEVTRDPSDRLLFFAYRQPSALSREALCVSRGSARLPSFGFEANGTYRITLPAPGFALAWQQGGHAPDPGAVCLHRGPENGTWAGSMRIGGVYIPIVVACKPFTGSIEAVTVYKNPTFQGDYREKWVFEFLTCLAYIYPIFSACWYLKCRFHPEFFIDLHHYMSVLPLVKSGVLFLEAELYRKRKIDPVDVAWWCGRGAAECAAPWTGRGLP
jgi:hypothetical protein